MEKDNDQKPVEISDDDIAEVPLPGAPKEGESIDWEERAKHFQGIATRRGTQLKKVKEFKPPEVKPKPNEPKAGELDYGQKAYLIANGVKDAGDVAFVQKAMTDTGKTLEEVMGSPFIQAELKRMGEERATKDAAPDARDRQGNPARDSVDYWVAKGELPPNTPENQQLRRKVVDAKLEKAKGTGNFTTTPVTGGGGK